MKHADKKHKNSNKRIMTKEKETIKRKCHQKLKKRTMNKHKEQQKC